MRVLITGGAGFIGSHLADLLVSEGHEIIVLDNLDPQVHPDGRWPAHLIARRGDRFLLIKGDVRVAEDVRMALRLSEKPVDVVVHLAAKVGVGQGQYQIARYYEANVQGTAVLLQEMLGIQRTGKTVPRLFVAGSMSSYGEGLYQSGPSIFPYATWRPSPRTDAQLETGAWDYPADEGGVHPEPIGIPEHEPLRPTSFYASTKAEQERMALLFGEVYGVPVWVGRFFNCYGTRQAIGNPYTGVVAIFANQIKAGERPTIYEDGEQTRDFINVQDLVEAIAFLVLGPVETAGVYNIGTGKGTSILGVAKAIADTLEEDVEPLVTGRFRSGDIRHCIADPSKLRALGWTPRIPLRAGLEVLFDWLERQEGGAGLQRKAHDEMEQRGLIR